MKEYPAFMEPTGQFGATFTPEQAGLLTVFGLAAAAGAGALLGQALWGKEAAITGGILGGVAAMIVAARRATA